MRARDCRGSVTAEAALVLPLLVAVAGLLTWLLGAGIAQVQCVDAARDAVRALARGEPQAQVVSETRQMAPRGAEIEVREEDGSVRVRISVAATPPGHLLDQVLSIPLAATSSMPVEASGLEG